MPIITKNTGLRPTVRPSFSVDFTTGGQNKFLNTGINFSRNTYRSTYIDAEGYVRYAGQNQPRIEHDYSTRQPRGLLIEEQKTNLSITSSKLGYASLAGHTNNASTGEQGWSYNEGDQTSSGVQVYPYHSIAPDGTWNATRLRLIGATYFINYPYNNGGITASANHTFSVWMKSYRNENQTVILAYESNNISITTTSVTVTPVWQRFTYTATSGLSPVANAFRPSIRNSTGVVDILVWGGQLEESAFATSYIPNEPEFSYRNSFATYVDSNGIIRYAEENEPRYSHRYDTESGKYIPTGLLLEETRTNLAGSITYQPWHIPTNYSPGVTATSYGNADIMAPDGSYRTSKITYSGGTGFNYDAYASVMPINVRYVVSMYIKPAAGTTMARVALGSGYANVWGNHVLDLTNNVSLDNDGQYSGLNAAGAVSGVIDCGNGWKRIWYSTVQNTTGGGPITWALYAYSDQASGAGNSSSGSFHIWGLQIETGSYPSSYIPTTLADGVNPVRQQDVVLAAVQRTRSKDVVRINDIDKSDWFNDSEGTLYAQYYNPVSSQTLTGVVAELGRGSDNDRYSILRSTDSPGRVMFYASSNGTTGVAMTNLQSVTANQLTKTAAAYKKNDFAASSGGATATTDTSGNIARGINSLSIGTNTYEGNVNAFQISKISYYPKRLSNEELQQLTK